MKKRYGKINVMKGLMQDLKDNQCYMWDKCRGIRMALNWKRFLLDSTAIIFYFINDKMFDKGEKIYG